MDFNTLDKLAKNPHYKMNQKQKAEWERLNRKEMIQFGTPETHNQKFERHDTNQDKIEVHTTRRTYGNRSK